MALTRVEVTPASFAQFFMSSSFVSEERVGFEPTELLRPSVFKTDALDHSATSPRCLDKNQDLSWWV